MKAKFVRPYRSKNPNSLGKRMWSYLMIGTPEEHVAFKKQQGKFFLETKEGDVLWNREEDHGKSPEIVVTQEGKFSMILDHEQVAYEKAQSRPLFAQMYFDQAQEQATESIDEKRARINGSLATKKVAVKEDANLED